MTQTPTTVDHSERAHAEFGPSSLKYYATCAGYHGNEGTNPAAEMGTRIHEALEVRDISSLQSEEEVRIYDRMLAEELETFDNVFGGTEDVTIHREMRLTLELDCKTPTFGTSDIVAWKGDVGLQIDYKTGISKIDEPRDNWQAKAYVLATFQMFPHLNVIHFAFLIPKRDEFLVGKFDRSEVAALRKEISDVISAAETTRLKWAAKTMDMDDLTASTNCRFCRHEDHCPALGGAVIEIARRYKPDLIPEGPIGQGDLDDPEVLQQLYKVAKIVDSWSAGIKMKVTEMAKSGTEFSALKLKSMGALKKTMNKKHLAQLAIEHGLGLDEVIEAADLTLNQLSGALYDKAPKGKKTFIVDNFEQEAITRGVVAVGPTRYTLSSK